MAFSIRRTDLLLSLSLVATIFAIWKYNEQTAWHDAFPQQLELARSEAEQKARSLAAPPTKHLSLYLERRSALRDTLQSLSTLPEGSLFLLELRTLPNASRIAVSLTFNPLQSQRPELPEWLSQRGETLRFQGMSPLPNREDAP